ncbi:MAG: hypothetical protein E7604_14845 [Ruminococcaceae bacterium]|nr:hypothetical protein [Oscillospiraceae bacterium]
MKRIICFLITALLLFSGCNNTLTAETSGQTEMDETNGSSTFTIAGELLTSQSIFVSGNQLFFHDNGYLSYLNFETGKTFVMCPDPLCLHGGDKKVDSECRAITFDDGHESVLVDGNEIWFTAWSYKKRSDGMHDRVLQLRMMDLKTMDLKIYLEDNTIIFREFWRYDGKTYLSYPNQITDEQGRVSYNGGNICRLEKNGKLTVVLESSDNHPYWSIVNVDESGLYVLSSDGVYRTDEEFSYLEPVDEGYSGEIMNGYTYYLEKTDEKQTAKGDTADVEIEEEFSLLDTSATVYRLMRRKLDGNSEPEELYKPVFGMNHTLAMNPKFFYLDHKRGLVYLIPLELSHQGSLLWEEDDPMTMQQMNITKPILTNIYSLTNGKLIELNPDTGETRVVLSDTGSDIVNLFGVKDGKVLAEFKLYNADELIRLKQSGENMSSSMDYRWKGSMELNID